LLERLYVFASGSFVHELWISIQRDVYPGEQPKELQKVSDTRWACRYAACKTLRDRLPAIISLLNELESGVKGSRALDARSLLLNIDARFVAMLTLMTDLLGRTHTISKMLQSTVDIGKAADLVNTIDQQLNEARSEDSHFENIWTYAQNTCQQCNLKTACDQALAGEVLADRVDASEGLCHAGRNRRLPAKYADSVVMETVGDRLAVDDKNAFRLHVYNPVMDSIIAKWDKRFSDSNCLVMNGIQCLCPTDDNFAQIAYIKPFAEIYGSDIDD